MKNLSYPVLVSAFTLFVALLLRSLQLIELPMDAFILPGHVSHFGLENSRLQLLAYVGVLGCISLLCLWLLLKPTIPIFSEMETQPISILGATLFAVTLLVIGDKPVGFSFGFVLTYAVLTLRPAVLASPIFQSRIFFNIVMALLVAYVAVYLVLPFFLQPIVGNLERVITIELHYAMTVLPGYDLLCCGDAGAVERSNYGISMLLLSALSGQISSFFVPLDQQLVFGVKIVQWVVLGLLLLAFRLVNKRNFLLIFATVIFLAPSLNAFGKAIYFPNQAGIRYLPFALGAILLACGMRVSKPKIIPFALATSVLLLLSPATGLAIFCGVLVFLILRRYRVDAPFKSISLSVIPFSGIVLGLFILLSSLILPLLLKNSSPSILSFLDLFVSGYGGLLRKPSTFALLLIFFSLLALMRGVLRARMGVITPVDAYQAGVGGTILLWLPYYLNRMAEWNLWFHVILLLLLFAPRINASSFKVLSKKQTFGSFYTRVAISLCVGLFANASVQTWRETLNYVEISSSECSASPQLVAGLCFIGAGDKELIAHKGYLEGLETKSNFLVFSHFPTQIRLAGFNQGFPWYEPFGEVYREEEKASVIEWINVKGPRYLVVEDPKNIVSKQVPNRSAHFQSLVEDLPAYGPPIRVEGWNIYERLTR